MSEQDGNAGHECASVNGFNCLLKRLSAMGWE